MKRHLLLGVGLMVGLGLLALRVAAQERAGEAGKDEAVKKLKVIEARAKGPKSGNISALEGPEVAADIIELKKNTETAIPVLAAAFTDETKDREFRLKCSQALREIGQDLPTEAISKIERFVRNSNEDPAIRIDSAHFILRRKGGPTPETKQLILNMSGSYFRRGIEKSRMRLLIIRELLSDTGAQDIMLDELRRGADLNQTVLMLGKMRSARAISPIRGLLVSTKMDKSFYTTRGYLALGEIGGSEAATTLIERLNARPKRMDRRMILLALGLTKDPRAKQVLIQNLNAHDDSFYGAALQGLSYLGDRSTLPTLQDELEKESAADKKFAIQKTISAINAGGENPDW